MHDYITWLRKRIGSEKIQLNFAAACICEQNRVLLQRRGDQDGWGFPGGGMELGESAQQQHTYPNGDVAQPITTFFYCTAVGGQFYVNGRETQELRYFTFEDAPALFTHQHRDALTDMIAGRRGVYR